MSARIWAPLVAIVLILFVVANAFFTVPQISEALVTQFGKPIRVITTPGLHVKLPFVQDVIPFDRRLLDYELPGEEVILGDQQRLVVDGFARFRITDPLAYYQAVGTTEDGIRARLGSILASSFRRVLGNETLPAVLSTARNRIMGEIRNEVNASMQGFGITIDDVRIRRADLPEENTQAVLARMQSERERVAALIRADGDQAATVIRAGADRERTVLLAEASARAAALRGEGEAQAITILGKAYDQDQGFFTIWRTLEVYRQGLASSHTELLLSPATPLLRYLNAAPKPEPAPDPAPDSGPESGPGSP
ncbi:MAG TPA: protease modulator HflC [Acetobacteraceae bacterium]|nr:protease modulator HflC [Acetobacteraceae bacterium]